MKARGRSARNVAHGIAVLLGVTIYLLFQIPARMRSSASSASSILLGIGVDAPDQIQPRVRRSARIVVIAANEPPRCSR